MREVNVQSQSWSVVDDDLAADEAEEFDETEGAYSFSYARV
ncbi:MULTISPECIES: hypothetical protein [Actinomadura]|uniref:Uncharacterized protein n=1 Tax=Actinomadura madurae TaxID=1993 RepID=A0A1I5TJI4_9ACTN|nr:hypothetical protein [Actinomadura madurae]SFP82817.1 hypothetical protein SAMN04489713_1187 [Actinomadura madurae]SPT51718.1 Uncharacterised protein [Actinomadura madurae]